MHVHQRPEECTSSYPFCLFLKRALSLAKLEIFPTAVHAQSAELSIWGVLLHGTAYQVPDTTVVVAVSLVIGARHCCMVLHPKYLILPVAVALVIGARFKIYLLRTAVLVVEQQRSF